MAQYNTISSLFKYLLQSSKRLIGDYVSSFFILVALHTIIMLTVIVSMHWLTQHMQFYAFSFGILSFRIALFALITGLWIGYFKLILQFIDKKWGGISNLFKFFYLLPQILFIRVLYYLTTLPFMVYLFYKFPYDIETYGTNIGEYFLDLSSNFEMIIADKISMGLYSAYFNTFDLIILCLLLIIPCWFTIRFWCAELLVVDKEYNIRNSLLISYKITFNTIHFISIFLFLILINIVAALFGFIILSLSLTCSYIMSFKYYKYLLYHNS